MSKRIFRITSIVLFIGLVICIFFVSCSAPKEEQQQQQLNTKQVDYCTKANINKMKFDYTDRDVSAKYDENIVNVKLNSNTASVDGDGVSVNSQKININKNGTYIFSGSFNDGQICVSGDDVKVQIVLENASINNSKGSAIYVEQANKVFVTLADGSTNTLSNGQNINDENETNAVIYSKDDLCLNGTGKLTINANTKHGINCNDNLTITGGIYNINSEKDGIRANDSIKISDGQFSVKSGSDCITVNKKDDEEKGYLVIDGGSFDLNSTNEALKSCTYMRINNGKFNIIANDDAIHNNVIIDINGGDFNISAKDDAIHTESELNINNGKINIKSCYEGLEAQNITINDGDISIVASDDSINASYAEWNTVDLENEPENQGMNLDSPDQQNPSGKSDSDILKGDGGFNNQFGGQAPQGQMPNGQMPQEQLPNGQMPNGPQGQMPQEQVPNGQMPNGPQGQMLQDPNMNDGPNLGMNFGVGDCKLIFNGGKVSVDSQGDGIDSNGDIEINGGTLLINGPFSGGDAPIDYGEGCKCSVNGGKVIAIGSVGMAENFTGGNQAFAMINVSGSAGTLVSIQNQSGKELNSITSTKAFQVVLVSDPEFKEGQSYKIVAGTSSQSFTASTTATNIGGFQNQMPGQVPNRQMPNDPNGQIPNPPDGQAPIDPYGQIPNNPNGQVPQVPQGSRF